MSAVEQTRYVKPGYRRRVRRERDTLDNKTAKALDLSVHDYRCRVAAHLRTLVAPPAEVSVRVWPESVPGILENGFRTSGELGLVNEETRRLRGREEARAFTRKDPLYGTVSAPDQPIYFDPETTGPDTRWDDQRYSEFARAHRTPAGGLAQADTHTGLDTYGPLRLVLDHSVRPFTTVTFGDSQLRYSDLAPAPISSPDWLCARGGEIPWATWRTLERLDRAMRYVETQIHRQVDVGDIVRVDVPELALDQPGTSEALRLLEDAGVPWCVVSREPTWARPLLAELRARSVSKDSRIHGELHWRSVARTVRVLAAETPRADEAVGLMFALFHDAARTSDGDDPDHGYRAAELYGELHDRFGLPLTDKQCELLMVALTLHDQGQVNNDPTIAVCWDADRLDLWRLGVEPDPALLSTLAGRLRIDEARWEHSLVLPWTVAFLSPAFRTHARNETEDLIGVA